MLIKSNLIFQFQVNINFFKYLKIFTGQISDDVILLSVQILLYTKYVGENYSYYCMYYKRCLKKQT